MSHHFRGDDTIITPGLLTQVIQMIYEGEVEPPPLPLHTAGWVLTAIALPDWSIKIFVKLCRSMLETHECEPKVHAHVFIVRNAMLVFPHRIRKVSIVIVSNSWSRKIYHFDVETILDQRHTCNLRQCSPHAVPCSLNNEVRIQGLKPCNLFEELWVNIRYARLVSSVDLTSFTLGPQMVIY